MSYGEVVLVQEWQVWRVVSRWVTIADGLVSSGYGVVGVIGGGGARSGYAEG